MGPFIQLLITVVFFAVIACGIHYVCERFRMPTPVFWICGACLLIALLLYASGQIGGPTIGKLYHGNP